MEGVSPTGLRLSELSRPLKTVVTLFLVMMGLGYLVSVFNLYLTYNLADGTPGLTAEDLRRSFHGQRNQTMLAAKIDGGSMEQFLPVPGHKETILSWLQDGSLEEDYPRVQPIIAEHCLSCHAPTGIMGVRRPLDSYERVKTVTVVDRGEPIGLWARVAHTHLMSLGLVFFCLGVIFSFCGGVGQTMKAWFMPMPFAALVIDFGARALIPYAPSLVYVMMAAGALMGLSMMVLTVGPLYEMWISDRKEPPVGKAPVPA